MRFTRHYSGSTVCAPSRCVLLTGLHTGHDWRAKRSGPRYEEAGVARIAKDYAPKLIADRLVDYIRKAGADQTKPFFAYYALNIPHANNEAGGEKRIDYDGMRANPFS